MSSNASYPINEVVASVPKGQPFFFQLYVNKDRKQSEELLKRVRAAGCSAVFVTVDAPVPGKREADERVSADPSTNAPMSGAQAVNDKKGGGLGRIMGNYIDSSLSWDDMQWLRRCWDGKIVLKGIMSAEDAKMAADAGVDGIVLSNHGGRSLDTSPPSIMILLECQRRCPEIFERLEVYVDGGIRRGADILKCLCLGAKAVGLGRPFLYSVNYGAEGVDHMVDSKSHVRHACGKTKLTKINSFERRVRDKHEAGRHQQPLGGASGSYQQLGCRPFSAYRSGSPLC